MAAEAPEAAEAEAQEVADAEAPEDADALLEDAEAAAAAVAELADAADAVVDGVDVELALGGVGGWHAQVAVHHGAPAAGARPACVLIVCRQSTI